MERVELIRLLGAVPTTNLPRDVVVEEREPAAFIAAFTEAVAAGGTVFLADPTWGDRERGQFKALLASGRVRAEAQDPGDGLGWLCIPTGGSSGNLRLARHDAATLAAAVQGFCIHFGVARVNAVGVLPLYHVSGLMAWLRTVITGGTYLPWSWKALEAGLRPPLALRAAGIAGSLEEADVGGEVGEGSDWFLSLVPTQLQRLQSNTEAEAWLRRFKAIFVGGGPAWTELIETGAGARLPLAFAYGMTETAAMVAALRPEEFLAGARGCGAPLPHTRIEIIPADGRIQISGSSLFRGYWPDTRAAGSWATEDHGQLDAQGRLHVLGRLDALIITGGEKVDPLEVENALRATGLFSDVVVLGLPDAQWGEVVVACHPSIDALMPAAPDLPQLAAYKHPKRYLALSAWPRSEQGKVNRAALRAQIT